MEEGKLLRINMFGGFSITTEGGGKVSDENNRSKKVLSLIEYLITYRTKKITQSGLIEMLWPEDDIDDPVNTLKTLLHRARSLVEKLGVGSGKDIIISRHGTYFWNNELPAIIDTEEFDRLCREAKNETGEKRLELMLGAIDIYRGDFLPKAASEAWAVPISTGFHSQYLNIVHAAIEALCEASRPDEIIGVCQKAIAIDPYDEGLHHSMISALSGAGMRQTALQHYYYVTDLFMTRFGVNPSPELTALYKEIVKTSNASEMDLSLIRSELSESEKQAGAFFCEYEFFKDIYRLQARAANRSGYVVHISLLTVMDASGKKLPQKRLNLAMDRLYNVILASLRRGDVFCRYSVTQYLLMLPAASYENSNMVLQRISRNFKTAYPHMNILLRYSALPVEPVME